MLDEDWLNELMRARQFEYGARLPISWKSVSYNLKHAADRLFDLYHSASERIIMRSIESFEESIKLGQPLNESRILEGEELEDSYDSGLLSVYFLLVGYAIENLLKGILMIQHPEYFKPNTKMTDIRSHNLVNLCVRCGITICNDEIKLLEKLATFIDWQGKYPIPLESEKMFPLKKDDGTWINRGEAYKGRQIQEKVNILYLKIWNELERHRKSEDA
jgi:hypothetical protein